MVGLCIPTGQNGPSRLLKSSTYYTDPEVRLLSPSPTTYVTIFLTAIYTHIYKYIYHVVIACSNDMLSLEVVA